MSVPFSSTVYTNELIQDQQARGVGDVLQNDPTVRQARGFGNFQEVYFIRGFPTFSDDMAYNGLYGLLPRQFVATEFLERVEVFRGPTAFLNGAAPGGSGLGGALNLVPKRAPPGALSRATIGLETGGQTYIAADLARRLGPEQRLGLRLNVARRDGDTAVDREARELSVASLGIDWRGTAVRLSADIGHQDHRLRAPRPSVTPSGVVPEAPDAVRNFAQSWTTSNGRDTFGTVRAEVDLSDTTTAWFGAGLRSGREANDLANPTVTNAQGAMSAFRFVNTREDSVRTGEIGARTTFATGAVRHTVTASAAMFAFETRNAFAFSNFGGFAGNLYQPFDVAPPPTTAFVGGVLAAPGVTQRTDTRSIALADTLGLFDERLLLTVGARQQQIEDRSYDPTTGADTGRYDASRVTPVAGAVWRFTPTLSAYGNYVEGLVRGDVAPAVSGGNAVVNAGQVFAPYRTRQQEVGLKFDAGRVGFGAALFQIARPTGYVENNVFGVFGEQRNRGLELTAYGEPWRGTRVLGGLTLLDTELTATQGGANNGKRAIGVPAAQANVGVEWDVPGDSGITLLGRVVHTGSQYADAANTLSVPAWTRLDIGARALVNVGSRLLTLRARIDNVTNENYWASVGGFPGAGYLVLGMPRTVFVTATADF
ncbi:MAG: TonB-dependent receptor [Burkholderiales bacterium]|nr:TonB-dependent receptor [Burkholderiales bacterium]